MKLVIMWYDDPLIEITFDKGIISSKLLRDNIVPHIPKNIYPDNITIKSFERFLESRVPSKNRFDIDKVIERYGLTEFNPLLMCKKSHGRKVTDPIWVKFDGESYTYDDIKLR